MAVTVNLEDVATESATDEYTDSLVYKRLAESSRTRDPKLKEILTKLSEEENRHYEFWLKYASKQKVQPNLVAV